MIIPQSAQDLLALKPFSIIRKSIMYLLIQGSKKESSDYYAGSDLVIGNTPQQGINWIGNIGSGSERDYKKITAVILKSFIDSQYIDGWNVNKTEFKYCFRIDKNKPSGYFLQLTPNLIIIQQKKFKYPVLLFSEMENKSDFQYQGKFYVDSSRTEGSNPFVILKPLLN